MIRKIHIINFIKELGQRIYKIPLIVFFIFPFLSIGQVTFSEQPIDLQLYARDSGDKGHVIFKGENADSSPSRYTSLRILVRNHSNGSTYKDIDHNLTYVSNVADFDIDVSIDVSLITSYDFEVFGVEGSNQDLLTSADEVVAGDVYVIMGQSNAVAERKAGSASAAGFESEFIRVYASGSDQPGHVPGVQDRWTEGRGDVGENAIGNTGQWGIKLANSIMNSENVPVAIFNGSDGGRPVSWFLAPSDYKTSQTSNYGRMYYRLNITGLKDDVKAILWSQGETDIEIGTTGSTYKSELNQLISSWNNDYSNVEKYIFQTKSGCGSIGVFKGVEIKEAQRQVAVEDSKVHLMQTIASEYIAGFFNCHFTFTGGYDLFADRIFKLIDRDVYGTGYGNDDIESPMPTAAYLSAPNTLTVETDTQNTLTILNPPTDINDFAFSNGANITSIVANGPNFEITFSGSLSSNTTLQYVGMGAGQNETNLIANEEGLELICFDKFPISLETIWDGNDWLPIAPTETMNAEIEGTYNASDGNIVARDLTVNNGENVNFDSGNGGTNSIVVHGDLNVLGSMTIGDTESLLIKNTNASVNISGSYDKKEKTTNLKSHHDVTYWSSSVQNASLSSVYSGVDANRIFQYDPLQANPGYTGAYEQYRHWFVVTGSMTPGKGYSIDGKTAMSYPGDMEIVFTGTPNYDDIAVTVSQYSTISGDYDKANLLGNPYPSAIDADALIDENSTIIEGGSIHVWTHSQTFTGPEYDISDYFTYNYMGASGSDIDDPYYIASGQGFMILSNQSSATFNFLNDMQVENQNDQFYKSQNSKKEVHIDKDRVWLKLTRDDGLRKEILIGFSDQATIGVDNGFDGILFNRDSPVTFYSLINKEKYAIQGMSPIAENIVRSIDLGFSISQIGGYEIGISKRQGALKDQTIYLLDKKLNITHDLSQGKYSFEQNLIGDYPDRFALQFIISVLDVGDFENENYLKITNNQRGFNIEANRIIKELKVYDILGRILYHEKPNKQIFEINLETVKKGTIVIVNTTLENNVILSNKAIKY